MKKLYIFLILGILLIGVGTSLAFGLDKKDFNKKVDKISAKELCENFYDEEKDKDKDKFKKCKNKDYEVDSVDGFIYQDSQGRYMID